MTSAPPAGRVLQVNISPGGVPKLPVAEARVGRLGLEGDAHDHDAVHGGPHRAVSLFAMEAIERVRADGHHGVGPGAVGENLTTIGIELSQLEVGTRLAIGGEVVLEISGPANPCDVIKGTFVRGRSGRISILLHPTDSRMYARVEHEGVVRPGDPIRILPPKLDTDAAVHHELDVLDSVERETWLALWRAAAGAGYDVRILDRGDSAAAASPDLPGSVFNRAFGMRQVPIQRPAMEALFRNAAAPGWLVVGVDDPAVAGRELDWPVGVHVGSIEDVLGLAADGGAPPTIDGLAIRQVDPDDAVEAVRWAELFIAGFGIDGPIADAWRRLNPILVRSRGYHQFIGSVDGRDVAASALFNRRRIAWLGAGTVLPEARGRGIQRALIADRVRRAADAGSRRVMATAEVDTRSAANLERFGIRRIWTRGHLRVDPVDPVGTVGSAGSAGTAGTMRA
jgi:MOSC domain-containing protein YiiM/ribosomal protein S18 acetylase RimI-like enzyme